jgi:signal transduction histidine kinase
MAETFERLRQIPLFDGLSDEDLERICTDVRDVELLPGEELFREGDAGRDAYVITSGEIEIVKATDRREVLLAVRGAGDVIGEMALLQEEPRIAGARARTDAGVLAIPKVALDELLDTSPQAARAVFNSFLSRLQATNEQLRESERLAQLGTLTAGVAHELNNPAAALARSADRLEDLLLDFTDRSIRMPPSASLITVLAELDTAKPASLDALERSDLESDLEDWLADHDVPAPWELSGELVDAGIAMETLEGLTEDHEGAELANAIRLLVTVTGMRRLARQMGDAATRISAIVRSLKSYSYLDQSPVQDVDIRQGLEDTLMLLAHKTKHVRIVRDFAETLPTITAYGTELNQVWTNLIDNACDALADVTDRIPTVTLRAYADGDAVVVEVSDNGPGIPPEVRARMFDAFFTTKPPGQGTGLGLQITYRIVVLEHRGDLTVDTEPGRTTFRVRLPIAGPDTDDDPPEEDVMDECTHLDAVVADSPRPEGGCEDCLAMGDTWVHLRYCETCAKVGCCDDSKNRHARAHAMSAGHPVVRSREPGENWAWCFEHGVGVEF